MFLATVGSLIVYECVFFASYYRGSNSACVSIVWYKGARIYMADEAIDHFFLVHALLTRINCNSTDTIPVFIMICYICGLHRTISFEL